MSVRLSTAPDTPVPASTAPDPDPIWSGPALMRDVRSVVSRQCGSASGWSEVRKSRERSADSDPEREALAQELAVWALEHRSKLQTLSTPERRAMLGSVLARDLIRDSRQWQDSLEGRYLFRTRSRQADGRRATAVLLSESAADQAERWRAADRAARPALIAFSMDALTDAHRDGNGTLDRLEQDATREALERDSDAYPAILRTGSPALARRATELIVCEINDREAERAERDGYTPLTLTRDTCVGISAAVRVACGEGVLSISRDLGVSKPTAERRAASGRAALKLATSAGMVARAMRQAAGELEPAPAVPDAPPPMRQHKRQPTRARRVLAYMSAVERATRPAGSLDTGTPEPDRQRTYRVTDSETGETITRIYSPPMVQAPVMVAGSLTLERRSAVQWDLDADGVAVPDPDECNVEGLPSRLDYVPLSNWTPEQRPGSLVFCDRPTPRGTASRKASECGPMWSAYRPDSASRIARQAERVARQAERTAADR